MASGETEKRKVLPPYIPWKTFLSFLESLKVGLPGRIDKSVMKSMSGGMKSGLTNTLQFMGLVLSDGTPTDEFQRLVKAYQDGQLQSELGDLFGSTYAFLFESGVNLDIATPKQLEDGLAQAGASGDTIQKCRAFMQAFARDAGITISPHLKRIERRPKVSRPRRQSAGKAPAQSQVDHHVELPPRTEKTQEQVLFEMLSPEMTDEERNSVFTLMMYLKKR